MVKITITGKIGSGKTTVGKMLARKLKHPFLSVGDIRRQIAQERGLTIQELNKVGESESWTDEVADKKQIDLGKIKNEFVIESRLGWFFIPDSIKIFLYVSSEEGARRVLNEKRSSEQKTNSLKEQIEINKKREEGSDKIRYQKIYKIENFLEKNHFDLIIDTSKISPEEVLSIILQTLKNINNFKHKNSFFKEKMYDIFSKKEEKIPEKPKETIEVDFREKNSLVPSELIKNSFSVEFKELKVADYIVKGIAIERKSAKDFFSSLFDKRLFSQLEELNQYDKKLLIIEGNIKKDSPLHENALRGLLLSIAIEYQTPIIFSKDEEDTAKYLTLIGKRERHEKQINATKKAFTKEEELIFIMESFKGIGSVKSKKLLEKFGSIKKIVNSSEKELKTTLGKEAKGFQEILNRKYRKNE